MSALMRGLNRVHGVRGDALLRRASAARPWACSPGRCWPSSSRSACSCSARPSSEAIGEAVDAHEPGRLALVGAPSGRSSAGALFVAVAGILRAGPGAQPGCAAAPRLAGAAVAVLIWVVASALLRRLRLALRRLRRRLGLAVGGHRDADLALADRPRAPAGRAGRGRGGPACDGARSGGADRRPGVISVARPRPGRPWSRSQRPVPRLVVRPLQDFLRLEASGGLVLLARDGRGPRVGQRRDRGLQRPLEHRGHAADRRPTSDHRDLLDIVNDGLMTIFFLVVGLEVKRELVVGELSHPRARRCCRRSPRWAAWCCPP